MGATRRFKGLAILLAALMALTFVGGCAKSKTEDTGAKPAANETKEPIKIGAVVSLTGTYAGLGEPEKNTLEMEAKRINDAGGINGRQIEIIIEDDGTDEAKAVTATTKLIDQDKVMALIGATGSGQTMAMRTEVDRASIPQVSMAGATAITSNFDKLVFQTPWSNKIVVPFTLEYMKKQGITKIGLISDTGGFGKDGAAIVAEEAAKAGVQIVSTQTFNPGDTDMSTQLTRIKSDGAQAILLVSAGKEASIVAKNRKDLGITLPLYGTHGNARKEFIDAAGATEGVKFAAGKILIPSTYGEDSEAFKVADDFVTRYKAAYGTEPNTFAGHAYDAINIIANAAKNVDGEVTSASLRDAIEKTSGFVGIGGTFTFSATDHNGMQASDIVMYEIKGGAWTLAQ
jgi:branched-chain amino acid transport system substrate-binding protein